MNNLRNEMEKYTKKINEIGEKEKELDEINKKFKEITKNLSYIDLKKDEKINQELDNLNEKEKELINNIKILKIEENLISNNIVYLFIKKYDKGIIEILKKYENKNIGEKTSEKIKKEIENYLKELKINNIYFYLNKHNFDSDYNLGNLTIIFLIDNNNYFQKIKIEYNFRVYNNLGKNYKYYDIKNCYEYNDKNTIFCSSKDMIFTEYKFIENTKEKSNYIYNLSKTKKDEFEKLKEKMKEVRYNMNNELDLLKLDNSISKNLEIDYQVNLY